MKKKIKTDLPRFVKDECANFSKHYQTCIDGKPCKVLAGKRCGYFERAVLGRPDYEYRLPDYDYQKLFAQYAELTKTEKKQVKVNTCSESGCERPIPTGRRYCDKCKRKRRLKTQREYHRKYRKEQKVSA